MTSQVPILCLVVIALLQYTVADVETEEHGSPTGRRKQADRQHYKNGEHDPEFDHEAILGSRHEASDFDDLSPEESRRRLRILAEKMDTNSDGQVTAEELTAWIEKSLKALDVEEVDERFEEIDEDRDGFITWDEYRLDTFGDEQESLDEDDQRLLNEDKKYFDAADMDKDGKLSKDEFGAFHNPEGYEHMFGALVEATLAEKDKNHDGKISFEEFVGDQAQGAGLGGAEAEWIQHERERFRETYDVDHDGFLAGEELRRWLVPDVRQTAQEETQHLMGNADKNKDGTLSIDEIADEYDLFVGSEATNYGEHLETIHEEL